MNDIREAKPSIAILLKAKQKLQNFVINNSEESISINRIEKFAKKTYVIASENFDFYLKRYKSKRRQYIVLFIQFINILTSMRFGISAIFNNQWILYIMSDANHLLGNQKLLSATISAAIIAVCFLIGGIIQYSEYKSCLYCFDIAMYIKNEHPDFVLKDKYRKKFCIQLKMSTKFFLKPVCYPMV